MADEMKTDTTIIKLDRTDKDFFLNNKELEEYLVFKHKRIIKRQEDFMHLIRLEIEENMGYDTKAVKKK